MTGLALMSTAASLWNAPTATSEWLFMSRSIPPETENPKEEAGGNRWRTCSAAMTFFPKKKIIIDLNFIWELL